MKTTFTEFARGWLAPPPPPTPGDAPVGGEAWGPARRAAFRFAFAYLLLYNGPGPLGLFSAVPYVGVALGAYDRAWEALAPWVARHVLRLPGDLPTATTGSGDMTYAYVLLACQLALALIATAAWTAADRRRPNYARLAGALRTYVRYTVAFSMLSYGMVKVIKSQFPDLGLEHLSRTYGESSPMGLLWTFMGYSAAYNAFAGAGEVLGGLLLFFRRTTALGALVVFAVMSNVAMLNFCYDVPVKLYSTHIVLMAVFLLSADGRRLADVFLLGRAASAPPARVAFRARWLERARPGLKALAIAGALWFCTSQALAGRKFRGPDAPKPELYGFYQVESFERAGGAAGGAAPWATLAVGRGGFVLRRADGAGRSLRVKIDPAKRRIGLQSPGGLPTGEGPLDLAYERPDPEHLRLEGAFENERVVVMFKKVPEPPSLLMSRGFHWVNEFPYNR